MCMSRDERLTVKHILRFFSDLIEIRETFYSSPGIKAVVIPLLFQVISLDNIFTSLKENNIFCRL